MGGLRYHELLLSHYNHHSQEIDMLVNDGHPLEIVIRLDNEPHSLLFIIAERGG
jgi:hypothetical protein